MKAVIFLCSLAGGLWFAMFSPWGIDDKFFWAVMMFSTGVLGCCALGIDRKRLGAVYFFKRWHVLVGVLFAGVLYFVFFAGNFLSMHIFSFAGSQVADVYSTRSSGRLWVIGLMLFLWIGPLEEVFWRGFVQRRLGERFGDWRGYLLTCGVYTLVHIFSFNLMLIAAAGVCGVFWGWMFKRFKSVWPGLISHALWDVLIFVILPVEHGVN